MTMRAAVLRAIAVLSAYVVIAAFYTHPLLLHLSDGVANDRYDPVLNASILWWNATTLPFSSAWWTPPHYYPDIGIAEKTVAGRRGEKAGAHCRPLPPVRLALKADPGILALDRLHYRRGRIGRPVVHHTDLPRPRT